MWSRRNTKSTRGTAYTGVNRSSATSANQQPNSGALAAALTIGNAMKQQNSSAVNKQQQSNIPRSISFQYKSTPSSSSSNTKSKTTYHQQPQPPHHQQQQPHSNSLSSTGSLLKRGSRSSIQTNHQQQLHAPRTFQQVLVVHPILQDIIVH